MAQVYNKLYVDVRREVTDIVTAVQKDANSRFLDVYLKDNGLPINLTGHTVRIYGKKLDGTEFYYNGTITSATAGRCQFELTDQALAVAQDLEVQIVIYYNNVQILQSLPFKIHVVKSLISSSAIPSSNEYGALIVLYQNLYEAHDLMTTMVQSFGNKGTVSTARSITTFWQALEYMAKYMDTNLTTLLNQVLANASVQGVIDRLGVTTDTGGTATAGTISAKLNKILTVTVPKKKTHQFVINTPANTMIPSGRVLLNVTGQGEFYGLASPIVRQIKVEIDGVEIISEYASSPGYTIYPTVALDLTNFANTSAFSLYNKSVVPLAFNSSLKITAYGTNYTVNEATQTKIGYALYE